MKFFLDTANLEDIKKYATWGIIDGVTTNPTLVAKEGVDFPTRIKEIAEVVDGPISAEVTEASADEMIKQGKEIAKWHKNIFVKVPMTSDGLKTVKALSAENIRTNVTLIFSTTQAVMAAKAGATFISPFVGRVDDTSYDGIELIADIVSIFRTYEFKTEVLSASIRHPKHVLDSMRVGADIATIPPNLFDKMVKHPLTDSGLASFAADWEKFQAEQK